MSYLASESAEVMVSVLASYVPDLVITQGPPAEVSPGQSFQIRGRVEGVEVGTGTQYVVQYPLMKLYRDGAQVQYLQGDENGNFTLPETVPATATGSITYLVEFVGADYQIDAPGVPADSEWPKFVYCEGSSVPFIVNVAIATAIINFDVNPKVTTPLTDIIAVGRLTRSDTGAGISGASISLWRRDGASASVATTTTLGDGTFSVTYRLPSASSGYYYFKARFGGGILGGIRFGAAESSEVRLGAPLAGLVVLGLLVVILIVSE